jgi:hypothetical protein
MGACLTQPTQQSEPSLHDIQTATDEPRSLADRVSSLAADLADTDAKARAPDAASTAGSASHPTRGDPARPPPAPASATLPKELELPRDADLAVRAAVRAFAAKVEQTAGPIVHVEGAEHRATTLRELGVLVEYVEQHSGSWIKRRYVDGAWRDVRGLKPEEVNLYDVNLNVLSRLGAELGVAYSELFSHGQQRKPKVFVSHAWSHSLLQTYEAIKQHAEDRGYGEDEPIWICAFAIRQHAVEIPTSIKDSPFFLALKMAVLTLTIISALDAGVLYRAWCALEAYLALIEGGPGHLTDIYTHHLGKVQRLTDGLIAADNSATGIKAVRDDLFPFDLLIKALAFKLSRTQASVQQDYDNIMAHIELEDSGELLLDDTVRARYFAAGLFAIARASNAAELFHTGLASLRHSALRRMVIATRLPTDRMLALVRALPRTLIELQMRGIEVGDRAVEILSGSTFLKSGFSLLSVLDLSRNALTDAAAIALAEALEVNETLTELNLCNNKIGDSGAICLGKALEVNATLLKT